MTPAVPENLEAQRDRRALECFMYSLDLLSAAWGWTQEEIAQAVHANPEDLRAWRGHYTAIPPEALERLRLLESAHYALWTTLPAGEYARWWRTPLGRWHDQTPLQVALSGPGGFEQIIGFCAAATW